MNCENMIFVMNVIRTYPRMPHCCHISVEKKAPFSESSFFAEVLSFRRLQMWALVYWQNYELCSVIQASAVLDEAMLTDPSLIGKVKEIVEGKKEPSAGWPSYDAKVLFIHEKKAVVLQEEAKWIKKAKENESSFSPKGRGCREKQNNRRFESSEESISSDDPPRPTGKENKKQLKSRTNDADKHLIDKILGKKNFDPTASTGESYDSLYKKNKMLKKENLYLKDENKALRDCNLRYQESDVANLLYEMKKMVRRSKKSGFVSTPTSPYEMDSPLGKMPRLHASSLSKAFDEINSTANGQDDFHTIEESSESFNHKDQSTSSADNCVPKTDIGCGVLVPSHLLLPLNKTDVLKMVRELMVVVFTVQEMTNSSVTGRKSNKEGAVKKKALDKSKVAAIIAYVQKHHPGVPATTVRQTMAYKLRDYVESSEGHSS